MHNSTWDDLRRQARSLENELDSKLVTFGTIHGNPSTVSNLHINGSSADSNDDKSSQTFHIMCSEIESILQRLTQVNDLMADYVHDRESSTIDPNNSRLSGNVVSGSVTTAGHASQLHTSRRHREILRDYTLEFRQTKAKIVAVREREDLIGSVYRDLSNREAYGLSGSRGNDGSTGTANVGGTRSNENQSSSTRLLLDEQEKYNHSNRLMDDHLAAASTIRAALRAQRIALRNASSGLHTLTNRFPRVKQLIGKIDWRHRQDSIVLALVIAVCIVFLILYKFS